MRADVIYSIYFIVDFKNKLRGRHLTLNDFPFLFERSDILNVFTYSSFILQSIKEITDYTDF